MYESIALATQSEEDRRRAAERIRRIQQARTPEEVAAAQVANREERAAELAPIIGQQDASQMATARANTATAANNLATEQIVAGQGPNEGLTANLPVVQYRGAGLEGHYANKAAVAPPPIMSATEGGALAGEKRSLAQGGHAGMGPLETPPAVPTPVQTAWQPETMKGIVRTTEIKKLMSQGMNYEQAADAVSQMERAGRLGGILPAAEGVPHGPGATYVGPGSVQTAVVPAPVPTAVSGGTLTLGPGAQPVAPIQPQTFTTKPSTMLGGQPGMAATITQRPSASDTAIAQRTAMENQARANALAAARVPAAVAGAQVATAEAAGAEAGPQARAATAAMGAPAVVAEAQRIYAQGMVAKDMAWAQTFAMMTPEQQNQVIMGAQVGPDQARAYAVAALTAAAAIETDPTRKTAMLAQVQAIVTGQPVTYDPGGWFRDPKVATPTGQPAIPIPPSNRGPVAVGPGGVANVR